MESILLSNSYYKIFAAVCAIFIVVFALLANHLHGQWQMLDRSYENVEASYLTLTNIKEMETHYLSVLDAHDNYVDTKNDIYLAKRRADQENLRASLETIKENVKEAQPALILNDIQFNILQLQELLSDQISISEEEQSEKFADLQKEIYTKKQAFEALTTKFLQNRKLALRNKIAKNDEIYSSIVTLLIISAVTLFFLLIVLLYFSVLIIRRKSISDAALEDTEGRLVLAIEATTDGIYDWNLKTNKVYFSESYWRILGHDDIKGGQKSIDDFKNIVFEEDQESVFNAVEEYLAGSRSEFDITFRMKTKSGKLIWIQSKGKALYDRKGDPYRLVGSVADISLQKAVETQLLRSKEHAEEANRAKSDFLAHMSHEIRTPLTSIIGIGELLKRRLDKNSDEKTGKLLETLNKSATTLRDLINNILDFSKIEAGEITLDYESMSVHDVIEPIVSILGVKAGEKSIDLKINNDIAKDEIFNLEPLRLKQILLNLISNAIKYTDEGSVEVTISQTEIEGLDFLSFKVEDTGIGIPENKLEIIFDSFKQLDSKDNRKNMGTGLGLSISSKLASLMKGYIHVESKPGVGSTFELFVPAEKIHKDTAVKKQADRALQTLKSELSKAPSIKILICEDYEGNIVYLETLLDELGYDFVIAKNGKEGLDEWKEKAFDVVLMDVQMPVMDGFQTTKAIRNLEEEEKIDDDKKSFIVGMTAHALVADEDKCISVGMNDYISKPIDEKRLIKILKTIEKKRA